MSKNFFEIKNSNYTFNMRKVNSQNKKEYYMFCDWVTNLIEGDALKMIVNGEVYFGHVQQTEKEFFPHPYDLVRLGLCADIKNNFFDLCLSAKREIIIELYPNFYEENPLIISYNPDNKIFSSKFKNDPESS